MPGLEGRTVALLEARRSAEVEHLIRMQGGVSLVAPALRELPVPDTRPLRAWLEALAEGRFSVVVFLTGVGCRALLDRADEFDMAERVYRGLEASRVVARGPKPVKVLREAGLRVDFVPPEPNTSDELLAELAGWALHGKHLGLQIYGGVTPFLERLRAGLEGLGTEVHEVAPYTWAGPADNSGIRRLIDACISGQVDALAIFSSSQAHNLFAVAEETDQTQALLDALNHPGFVVASVGPVASQALMSLGVHVDVQPEHPKMGHVVLALADHFAKVATGG